MAPEVKPAKNSKLPKLPENYFELVGKGGWPPISTWINCKENHATHNLSEQRKGRKCGRSRADARERGKENSGKTQSE
jgi:hypothetical protein